MARVSPQATAADPNMSWGVSPSHRKTAKVPALAPLLHKPSLCKLRRAVVEIEDLSGVLTLDDLTPGDVVIKVSHSTINYKDALAATGAGRILRRYPLNGGIDLAAGCRSLVVHDADPHLGDEPARADDRLQLGRWQRPGRARIYPARS